MADAEKLAKQAKEAAENVVEKRGGTDSLKEDGKELQDIAKRDESLLDKVKDAAEALKDPGKKGPG